MHISTAAYTETQEKEYRIVEMVYCITPHPASFFGRHIVGHTLYFYDKELSNSHMCQKTSLTQLYDFSEVNAATLICISSRATCPRFILLCQHKEGTQQKHNVQLPCWRDDQRQLLWAVKEKHPNAWLIAERSCSDRISMWMNQTWGVQPPPLWHQSYTYSKDDKSSQSES